MLLEKGKISNFQLSVLITGFVFGSSLIISPGGRIAGRDSWIAGALGLMEGLLIAWIFTALIRQFKNKTIVEINSIVYGKVLGKCISVLFVWYFFQLGSLVLNNYIRFFKLELYPNTPKTVGLVLIMLVCASTVNRGIEVLARCSVFLVPLTILVIISDSLLSIPNIDLNNLLPILDVPFGQLLSAAHGAASFPFAETVAFSMVLAFVEKPETGPAAVSKGLLMAGLIFIVIAVRNTAVLGPMADVTNYPTFRTVEAVDIGEVLTNLEALVAINLITMGFLKTSVVFYGTVLGLAQIFNLRSYRTLILPVGILMVILALTTNRNIAEMFDFATKTWPIYSIPFQIGIPLLTLVVAKLRKLPQTGGDQA